MDISHTAVVRSGYQMSCSSEQVGSVVGEGGGMVEWKKEGEILAGSGRVLVFQVSGGSRQLAIASFPGSHPAFHRLQLISS